MCVKVIRGASYEPGLGRLGPKYRLFRNWHHRRRRRRGQACSLWIFTHNAAKCWLFSQQDSFAKTIQLMPTIIVLYYDW